MKNKCKKMYQLKGLKYVLAVVFLVIADVGLAQKAPQFLEGEDPKPVNGKWKLIKNMSDEFNGKKIDDKKWQTSGQGWIGRAPGLFLADNVKVVDGSLQITTTMLSSTVKKENKEFTHGGGYVGSRFGMTYGYYECEMKANKTFMSSTFWLFNEGGDLEGCDKRTTELDIQECVGQITGTVNTTFDETIHSNTHSRNTTCPETPTGSVGNNSSIGAKVWADYHVYGAWWKSPTEIEFYLDGEKVYTITPKANFDLPMQLRLVIETYNWNPVPADGGMTGTEDERTTFYDWVRTWELK